jgi:hypothetical protein
MVGESETIVGESKARGGEGKAGQASRYGKAHSISFNDCPMGVRKS